jgi:hypothetical protein
MLLSAHLPLIDARSFLSFDTRRIEPTLFLRSFGAIRQRSTGGFESTAASALRLAPGFDDGWSGAAGAFRALATDDGVALRFEIGVRCSGGRSEDTGSQLEAALRRFTRVRGRVPAETGAPEAPIAHAARFLARTYARATTRASARASVLPFWVTNGHPAFFVQRSAEEGAIAAAWGASLVEAGRSGVRVARADVPYAGRRARVWILESDGTAAARHAATTLRAGLAAWHAEREAARAILEHVAFGRLAPPPRSGASDFLQAWLNETIRRVERAGKRLPATDVPGDEAGPAAEALLAALAALDFRGNLRRKCLAWYAPAAAPRACPPARYEHGPASFLEFAEAEVLKLASSEPIRATLSVGGARDVAPEETVVFALALSIAPPGPLGPFAASLGIPLPETGQVDVQAVVTSTDFRPLNGARECGWSRWFKIGRSGAAPSSWEIPARAMGVRPSYALQVKFVAAGGASLGSVDLRLPRRGEAVATGPGAIGEGSIGVPGESVGTGIVLHITQEGGSYVMHWIEGPGDDRQYPFNITTDAYFSDLANRQSYDDIVEFGAGIIPDLDARLNDLLHSDALAGKPLHILSPAPLVPLEMVPLHDGGPLIGEDRPVTRWVDGEWTPPDARVDVEEVLCIRPDYTDEPLPSAAGEERALADRIKPRLLEHVGTRAEFIGALRASSARLVHFAGHVNDSPPMLWLAGGESVPPTVFFDKPLMGRRPFLFLNGCKAASAATGAPAAQANMMKSLLRFKFVGVVAPLIKVDSRAASEAARTFYDAVISGSSVAGAVQAIHRLAKGDPAEAATYLSYMAYTQPGLRLAFAAPAKGGAGAP